MAKAEVNQSELVREQLEAGVEKPKLIMEAIKKKHGVEVSAGSVNQAKQKWKKAGGTAGTKKATPLFDAQAAPQATAPAETIDQYNYRKGIASVAANGTIGVHAGGLIQQLRDLKEQLGATAIKRLVDEV